TLGNQAGRSCEITFHWWVTSLSPVAEVRLFSVGLAHQTGLADVLSDLCLSFTQPPFVVRQAGVGRGHNVPLDAPDLALHRSQLRPLGFKLRVVLIQVYHRVKTWHVSRLGAPAVRV